MSEPEIDIRQQFWLRVRAGFGLIVFVGVFSAVWLVAFGGDGGPGPVLPDTAEQFSLDLSVATTVEHEVVYAVEQRARPNYRIMAFDPSSGVDETIFTVPEDAVIFGIALDAERERLAVSYALDFKVEGNGIWVLDLGTLAFEQLSPQVTDLYLTELEWSADGNEIYATHVDRRGEAEQLSVASIATTTGAVEVIVDNAITPAVDDGGLFYLTVDEEKARRAIGHLSDTGASTTIEVLDGTRDLDHLIAGGDDDEALMVAVLDEQEEESALSIGTAASAHGNHNIRSAWWSVDDQSAVVGPTDYEPIIVYDAALSPAGSIVYATLEGLSIAGDERVDLIKSRAIRFVAA